MKYLLIILSFCALQLQAQEEKPANWFTNLAEAEAYADSNATNILMVFAGSDWCRPCIQFKQDILTADTFSNFASDNLAILYLDFPARRKNQLEAEQKAHNEALAEKYNESGAFPTIILLNTAGEVLAKPTFKGQSPEDFITELSQIAIK